MTIVNNAAVMGVQIPNNLAGVATVAYSLDLESSFDLNDKRIKSKRKDMEED